MESLNSMIILIFITACIVILFLNYRESFTSLIDSSQVVTDNLSNINVIETTSPDFKEEINDIIDHILTELNRLYKKQMVRINVERAEKKHMIGERYSYQVFVFVFNYAKESNAKLNIKFDVIGTYVKVNSVDVMGSLASLFKHRDGIDTRGQVEFKRPIDIDTVRFDSNMPLEFSDVDFKETTDKMVDRNSWILPKERTLLGNIKTFPSKQVVSEWNSYGIAEYESGTNDQHLGGINHGTRRFSLVPNFYKNNFQICDGDYVWLFDTSKDVVSRPLGVA